MWNHWLDIDWIMGEYGDIFDDEIATPPRHEPAIVEEEHTCPFFEPER